MTVYDTLIGVPPMRWVLHGNVTPAAAEALARHEQKTFAVAELNVAPDAPPLEFFKAAQTKQLDVMTTDAALVNAIFDEKIRFNRVVVYLQLEGGDTDRHRQPARVARPGRIEQQPAAGDASGDGDCHCRAGNRPLRLQGGVPLAGAPSLGARER